MVTEGYRRSERGRRHAGRRGAWTVLVAAILLVGPTVGTIAIGPTAPAPRSPGRSRLQIEALPPPSFGWNERTYSLPGFDPLSGYFNPGQNPGSGYQIPTLSANYGGAFGIYYVDNSSNFDELQLSNATVRTVAHVIPLYQLFGYGSTLNGMLDDEFFIDYGYDQALFFGTTSSSGSVYSLELVNLTSGRLQMWNTTAVTDGYNQQPFFIGNNTVLVISSNCSIQAYNLASRISWNAGSVGAGFGSGSTCFEANNIYWFPEKQQLVNVEAHGDTGDHVEQLNATYSSQGQIRFTSVATIAVDVGATFNWVNGLAYNASTDRIAFTAGDWALSSVYTYVVGYNTKGLLTTTGEVRYDAYTGGPITGELINIQRYIYTSDYLVGQGQGPTYWTNSTQYLFDPWNGSTIQANRTVDRFHYGNSGFEGQYPRSLDFLLDFNATIDLGNPNVNTPMYKVVYAYHGNFTAYPSISEELTPSSGPNRTLVTVGGSGLVPHTVYNYCWATNGSSVGCSATHNFTSTASGGIPTGVTTTRSGGSAWLAISKGSSAANFTVSAPFRVTNATLDPTPSSGPNRTLVSLAGKGFAPGTTYNFCWVANSSAVGCRSTENFTTTGSGGIPAGVTSTWSGGDAWLAISQGNSSTNYIVSSFFTETTANLTLAPGAGPNGTLVTLEGSGYGPNATYDVCWTGNSSAVGCASSASLTANSTGGIPAGTTATWTGGGNWLAISQGSSSANFIVSAPFAVTKASLTLSPNRGPNGTIVGLSGTGFANLTRYDYCRIGTASAVGCGSQDAFTSNASGGIPGNVTLSWSGGSGWLAISQGTAATNFILSTAFTTTTPTLTFSPSRGPPGTEVSIRGTGLVPGTTYDYCWTTTSAPQGCAATRTFTSTSSGDIPTGISFPWPKGFGWLALSEGPSATNFIVSSPFQTTTPVLSMLPAEGPNGTLVALGGSGLAAGTVYDYCWAVNSSAVGCPTADNFTSTSGGAVPSGATATREGGSGWLAISEGPSPSNFIVSTWFPLTTAHASLTPGSGPNGTLTELAGSGFAPNTRYDYCWASDASAVGCAPNATFTSDALGGIPTGIRTTRTGGSGWLAISQGPSATNFIVSTEFNATPARLVLTPGSGPLGTILGVGGSGFAASTQYDYCWTGSSAALGCGPKQNLTTNVSGAIPADVWATLSASGSWLAISQGPSATNFIVSTEFLTTTPALVLAPSVGPVHSLVLLTGTGLAPTTLYDYCFNTSAGEGCPGAHTFVTDSTGSVPNGVELRVPSSTQRTLDLSQGPTEPIASSAFTVSVPAVSLTIAGGPANAVTTVVGTGFAGNGSVTIAVGGVNVSGFSGCTSGTTSGNSIVTDPGGRFACSFRIPGTAPPGSEGVVATDGSSGVSVASEFLVTQPSLVLSALSGGRGDAVDVSGSGFDRSGNVTLTLGHLRVGSITGCTSGSDNGSTIGTTASGGFACTFTVPSGAIPGAAVLTATGSGSGATASANFTVLAPPPGPPTLLGLPEDIGIALIAAVAIGALGALLWIRRRSGGGHRGTEEEPGPSEGPPAEDAGPAEPEIPPEPEPADEAPYSEPVVSGESGDPEPS